MLYSHREKLFVYLFFNSLLIESKVNEIFRNKLILWGSFIFTETEELYFCSELFLSLCICQCSCVQECEESTVTSVAVYLGPSFHQQWEKCLRVKKENCELGLCQVELAMEFLRKAGSDRNVKWWKLSFYGIKAYWQHLQEQVQNTNFWLLLLNNGFYWWS